MKILPWFATLLNLLEAGSSNCPILDDLARPERMIEASKGICVRTGPLISIIPENVAKVRKLLPESMINTGKFFDQVADEDHFFQNLYTKQCHFFGISKKDLADWSMDEPTAFLQKLFQNQCQSGNLKTGVLAILTIELAATFYGRRSYQIAEHYFQDPAHNSIEGKLFTEQDKLDGLAWARYHAKPHARQALWIKGLSEELNIDPPNKLPESVIQLVDAIYKWWRSPLKVERELVRK